MKKIVTLLMLVLLIAGAMALTACSADEHYEGMVGTWSWDQFSDIYYVFNADGTGYRDFAAGHDSFSWSTSGTRLNINRNSAPSGERRNERWTFTITGDTLNLASQDETHRVYNYYRLLPGVQDSVLVGRWNWDELDIIYYMFNADATGYRDFGAGRDSFTWSTSGTRLNVSLDNPLPGGIRNERWTYTLSGDILTLASQQEAGMVFNYIRD